jgi:hypothetical protein
MAGARPACVGDGCGNSAMLAVLVALVVMGVSYVPALQSGPHCRSRLAALRW